MKHVFYILLLAIFLGCKSENKGSDVGKTVISEKKSKSLINGKWKVINSTVLPFEHISYCEKLELNSVFEFKTDQTLNVYKSPKGKACTKDQTFKVRGKKLEILEWDMIFDYEIMKLTSDTLELKIKRIPSYFLAEGILNALNFEKKLKEIKENGIIITLENIKNGG